MKVHSILLNACLILTTGCLGAGYLLAGYWPILPVLLVIFLFWTFASKRPEFWPASSLLLAYVFLAAIGITVDVSSILMMAACTGALLCWDLMLFNQSIVANSPPRANASLEKYHLQSLALAASAGLILALLSSTINLQFPFVLIVFLVLMTTGCLLYSMQYILKKNL
jgi:hypothetical protein